MLFVKQKLSDCDVFLNLDHVTRAVITGTTKDGKPGFKAALTWVSGITTSVTLSGAEAMRLEAVLDATLLVGESKAKEAKE